MVIIANTVLKMRRKISGISILHKAIISSTIYHFLFHLNIYQQCEPPNNTIHYVLSFLTHQQHHIQLPAGLALDILQKLMTGIHCQLTSSKLTTMIKFYIIIVAQLLFIQLTANFVIILLFLLSVIINICQVLFHCPSNEHSLNIYTKDIATRVGL